MPERLLHPVPDDDRHTLTQWAPYCRYWTAWDNWQVAEATWLTQMRQREQKPPLVFGWGGGVTVAELELARRAGYRVAMTASTDARLARLRAAGITAVDRRDFADLWYDADRYEADAEYRERYRFAEKEFLRVIDELSDGYGVSIFIDNLGGPLYRATLKALGRQAVLATAGWKYGMRLSTLRATECITRHIHVHTHAARLVDVPQIVEFQRSTGFLPDMTAEPIYSWDRVPELAADFAAGRVEGYFPLFQVNLE
jgi:NADPH:quinone reductase-like Zn-dependent oxidoreductase